MTGQLRPAVVAHADWGTHPRKRWMARAVRRQDGVYLVHPPAKVGEPGTLLQRLSDEAGGDGCVLVGFDFPIGLPADHARRAGVSSFLELLPQLGRGQWAGFYRLCERPEEVSLRRRFYPRRPAGTSQKHLMEGLGVESMDELRRQCDRAYPGRRAAAPLFWTLGAQQVGRAAVSGWRDVLVPALADESLDLAIWPFSGALHELLRPGRVVVVETYPAELYLHLGVSFPASSSRKTSKRVQSDRRVQAPVLERWAEAAGVELSPECRAVLEGGFGPNASGEDPFDALVGLLGMLNVALGHRPSGEPDSDEVRRCEGWILGQETRSSGLQLSEAS